MNLGLILANLLISILLIKHSIDLATKLKKAKLDSQLSAYVVSFISLVGIVIYFIVTCSFADNISALVSLWCFSSCFILFSIIVKKTRKTLSEIAKQDLKREVLRTTFDVRKFLNREGYETYGKPIYLVCYQEVYYWHVGEDLNHAEFLVSIKGEIIKNLDVKYIFIKQAVTKVRFTYPFLESHDLDLENEDFHFLEEVLKDYNEIEVS
ncbi:MAG: hypothetical protein ACK5N8_00795 [Alphaproteobacteria bacterium]